MRYLPLVTILLVACGGSSNNTGDTSDDTVADMTDTTGDAVPDSTPEDTTSDPTPDTAEDTETDTEEDTSEDTSPDSLTACEAHGGECTGLVAGCAVCPSGSLPYHMGMGCPDTEWCCMPGTPGETACEEARGICIPVIPDSVCPPGWASAEFDCSGEGTGCCLPSDSCA
jgi:hypothetical protein